MYNLNKNLDIQINKIITDLKEFKHQHNPELFITYPFKIKPVQNTIFTVIKNKRDFLIAY